MRINKIYFSIKTGFVINFSFLSLSGFEHGHKKLKPFLTNICSP